MFAREQAARYQDLTQSYAGTVQNAQMYTSQLNLNTAVEILRVDSNRAFSRV